MSIAGHSYYEELKKRLVRQGWALRAAQAHVIQVERIARSGKDDTPEVTARTVTIELDAIARHLGEAMAAVQDCRGISLVPPARMIEYLPPDGDATEVPYVDDV